MYYIIILCTFLGVHEVEDQALCLYLGREVGINMDAIVVAAVVDVRTSHAVDNVRIKLQNLEA